MPGNKTLLPRQTYRYLNSKVRLKGIKTKYMRGNSLRCSHSQLNTAFKTSKQLRNEQVNINHIVTGCVLSPILLREKYVLFMCKTLKLHSLLHLSKVKHCSQSSFVKSHTKLKLTKYILRTRAMTHYVSVKIK